MYQKAAKANYSRGNYNLGVCYDLGEGVEQDVNKAVEHYQKAASQGYAVAQYYLGVCYNHGKGMEQRDFQLALDSWNKAAKQGHALAQMVLGNYYKEGGHGIEKDSVKAAEFLKSSVEWGDERAWNKLKELLLTSGLFEEVKLSDEQKFKVASLYDQLCLYYYKQWTHYNPNPMKENDQSQLPTEIPEKVRDGAKQCHNHQCTNVFFGEGRVVRRFSLKQEGSTDAYQIELNFCSVHCSSCF